MRGSWTADVEVTKRSRPRRRTCQQQKTRGRCSNLWHRCPLRRLFPHRHPLRRQFPLRSIQLTSVPSAEHSTDAASTPAAAEDNESSPIQEAASTALSSSAAASTAAWARDATTTQAVVIEHKINTAAMGTRASHLLKALGAPWPRSSWRLDAGANGERLRSAMYCRWRDPVVVTAR